MFGTNPLTFIIALAGGMIPAILWLSFWLREDNKRKEPLGILFLTFLAGMLAVILVLPLEKVIDAIFQDANLKIVLWAASEELLKYFAFAVIVLGGTTLDEPVDYPIYLMTAALGFSALENAFFLVNPLSQGDTIVSVLTGNLRYLGATLLHAVCSGLIGVVLGLAFFKPKYQRGSYFFLGFLGAVALHSLFNFFIIQDGGENFFQVFGFLWVVTIIIMLIFEKLRRMSAYKTTPTVPETI